MRFSGAQKRSAHDESGAVACEVCAALVPRSLMQVHRAWHDEPAIQPFHDTGGASAQSSLEEWLAIVGQLKAVPEVRPRAEFVTEVRERLMAEALEAMINEQDVRSHYGY